MGRPTCWLVAQTNLMSGSPWLAKILNFEGRARGLISYVLHELSSGGSLSSASALLLYVTSNFLTPSPRAVWSNRPCVSPLDRLIRWWSLVKIFGDSS